MYGKTHSAETKAKLNEALIGKTRSVETRTKMSEAKTGKNNPMHDKTGENNPISKRVFVYSNSTPTILCHEFVSYSEAAPLGGRGAQPQRG